MKILRKKYLVLFMLIIVLLTSTVVSSQQFLLSSFEKGLQSLQYFSSGLDKLIPALRPLETASREFRTSVEQGENIDESLLFIGLISYQQGDFQGAKDSFTSYSQRNPQESWVYSIIGDLDYMLGDSDQALDNYQRSIEEEDYAKAYYGIGMIYRDQGLTEAAIENFAASVELEPGFSDARMALALEYFNDQQFDLALEEFEMVYLQNPRNAKVHFYLWILYSENGETEKAIHSRDLAIQYDPSYATIIEQYQQDEIAL